MRAWILTVLALGILLTAAPQAMGATATSSTSSVTGFTIELTGSNQSVALSVPQQDLPSSTLASATLQIQTPTAVPEDPSDIKVEAADGTNWDWPYTLGESFTSQLSVSNGSASTYTILPSEFNLTGGSALVTGPATAPYTIAVQLANQTAYSVSGQNSKPYAPLSPLPWAAASSLVSAMDTQGLPDGESLLVYGTYGGQLTVDQVGPGAPGTVLISQSLQDSIPVTAVTANALLQGGSEAVVAAAGGDLFVFNATSSGGWIRSVLILPNRAYPATIDHLALLHVGSTPVLYAATTTGGVYESSWSLTGPSGGWSNPMGLVANLTSTNMSMAAAPDGTSSLLALSLPSGVSLYQTGQYSLTLVANISTPSRPTALEFNSSGTGLVIGASNGDLYSAESPWTSPPTSTVVSSAPLTGVSVVNSGVAATDASQRLWFANATATQLIGQLNSTEGLVGPSTDSILGTAEPDLLVGAGLSIYVSRATGTFTSSTFDWSSALWAAANRTAPSHDEDGNPILRVSVGLSATDCAAGLKAGFVTYNSTLNISLSPAAFSELIANASGGTVTLGSVQSPNPGTIHLTFFLTPRAPPTPPPPPTWWGSAGSAIVSFFRRTYLYLVIGLVAIGLAAVSLGTFGYWRKPAHPTVTAPAPAAGQSPVGPAGTSPK